MNGPTLQEDITSFTLRGRKHTYAITADIGKITADIGQIEKNCNVWRWNHYETIKEFKLVALTFGIKSTAHFDCQVSTNVERS